MHEKQKGTDVSKIEELSLKFCGTESVIVDQIMTILLSTSSSKGSMVTNYASTKENTKDFFSVI